MVSRRMVAKIGDGSAETPAKPDPRGNEPNTDYENLQFFFHSDHLGFNKLHDRPFRGSKPTCSVFPVWRDNDRRA